MQNQPAPKPVHHNKKAVARAERERQQRQYLIIGTIVVAVLVVAVIIFGILDQTVLKMNRTVATVDGEKITLREFTDAVRYQRFQLIGNYNQNLQLAQMFSADPNMSQQFNASLQQIEGQLSKDGAEALGNNVLDGLIDEKIIMLEAQKRGITVTDQEIDLGIQEAFGFYANGTPTPEATEAILPTSTLSALQMTLVPPTATPSVPTPTAEPAPTLEPSPTIDPSLPTATPLPSATPYTVDGFQGRLKEFQTSLTNDKIPAEYVRTILRSQLLRKKLEESLTKEIPATQDQVWARHILIKDETAAKVVLDRLNKGEDFAKLAAEASEDPGSKDAGGDLGWFSRGRMVKEFEDAAFSLEIGATSDLVKSQHGYHIIQVIGKETRPLDKASLDVQLNKALSDLISTYKTEDRLKKFDNWQTEVPLDPTL